MPDEQEKQEPDKLFESMKEIKPPRVEKQEDIDLDDDVEVQGEPTSLKQSMKTSTKKSDIQVILEYLNPEFKNESLTKLTRGRVFPDTMNPLRNINIKQLLQDFPDMSFAEAVNEIEAAVTIPLDGEGRMDNIAVAIHKTGYEDEKENKEKF